MRRREFMAATIGVPVLSAFDLPANDLSQPNTIKHWELATQTISKTLSWSPEKVCASIPLRTRRRDTNGQAQAPTVLPWPMPVMR